MSMSHMMQGFLEALFFCDSTSIDSKDWFKDNIQDMLNEGRLDGNLHGMCKGKEVSSFYTKQGKVKIYISG